MLSWIAEKVSDTAKYILGIHEVELTPDQDSVTEPGSLSIISGSLDEIEPKVSTEKLLQEIENSLRWPVDAMTEHVMKSCDVEEKGPDEFIVKVIIDGQKLDSWGRGRGDGCDRVKTWKKVVIDRKEKRITTWDYVPEASFGEWIDLATDKEVTAMFNLAMLSEPSRFECWLMKGSERIANAEFANFMYSWTDPIIKGIKSEMSAKVKVVIGPSPSDASKTSAISDPMDEFIDYDTYFEAMCSKTKQFFQSIPDTVIEDVSENEYVANTTMKDKDDKETVHPKRIKFSQETGEMQIVYESADGKSKTHIYRVLHQSPLRLEAWNVSEAGERKVPVSLVKQIAVEVNETIG